MSTNGADVSSYFAHVADKMPSCQQNDVTDTASSLISFVKNSNIFRDPGPANRSPGTAISL